MTPVDKFDVDYPNRGWGLPKFGECNGYRNGQLRINIAKCELVE